MKGPTVVKCNRLPQEAAHKVFYQLYFQRRLSADKVQNDGLGDVFVQICVLLGVFLENISTIFRAVSLRITWHGFLLC